MRSVARACVDTLYAHGCDRLFHVPGRSTVSLLEHLRSANSIDVVTCRHESGAALMAIGDSRMTGRPSLVSVGRGPGATNAALAMHMAHEDGVPLILIVGHVPRRDIGRGAFQEIDYDCFYGQMSRGIFVLLEPDQAVTMTARAVHAAREGRGPVVIALPEDLQDAEVDVPDVSCTASATCQPSDDAMKKVSELLKRSRRPIFIPGELLDNPEGRRLVPAVAEKHDLNVVPSCLRQHLFPNEHKNYGGVLTFLVAPEWRAKLHECDLIVAVGTRFDDATAGRHINSLFPKSPRSEQPFVHAHEDALALNKGTFADMPIQSDANAFCRSLMSLDAASERDTAWQTGLHDLFLHYATTHPDAPSEGVDFGAAVRAVVQRLDNDATVCLDAGNFATWVHRHWLVRGNQRLIASVNGAMGLGVPAGVACAMRQPGRQVVAFVGDGGFLMTGVELLAAVQRRLPILVVVSNNGTYGSVRAIQERKFPRNKFATDLHNPDIANFARSLGARVVTAEASGAVSDSAAEALTAAKEGPTVLEVRSNLHRLSAFMTLSN